MRLLTEQEPVSMNDGSIKPLSEVASGETYTLPTATATRLGGVKVGDGLNIAGDGTLSASGGSSSISTFEWEVASENVQIVQNNSIRIGDALIVAISLYLSENLSSYTDVIKNETITGSDISNRNVYIYATSAPPSNGAPRSANMLARLTSGQSKYLVIATEGTINAASYPYLTILGVLSLKDMYIGG